MASPPTSSSESQLGTASAIPAREIQPKPVVDVGTPATISEIVIPVMVEEARITKKPVERTVRIEKLVDQRTETIDALLAQEDVSIERIPMNQVVQEPVAMRYEGQTLVIPLVEEVTVIEKRLVIREEVRITRLRKEEHHPETVTLRSERVEITRPNTPLSSPQQPGTASAPASGVASNNGQGATPGARRVGDQ